MAFIVLLIFYPHHLKLKDKRHEILLAGAGFFGIVLYFMLENTALTMTYASNVGIIMAITGIIAISLNGQKNFALNPLGDGLAFLAMISWGFYYAQKSF